jgi:hypothetical protein
VSSGARGLPVVVDSNQVPATKVCFLSITSRYCATIRIDEFGGFAEAKCGFPKRPNSLIGRAPAIVPQKNEGLTLDYTPGCNFLERSEADANWDHRKEDRP